jgi:O-acetyl-ADP-ribose deacetylase (regulator of RNase III)
MQVYERRSLFDSECEYLTNTINIVGAMGAGLALEFRLRVPEMYELYKQKCNRGELRIGEYWIYDKPNRMGKKILNFPVKKSFSHPSRWEYIIKGLEYFVENYKRDGIKSIAFPTLGSRLGKLDDQAVLIMMQDELVSLPIDIELYRNYSEDRLTKWVKMQIDKMTASEISIELSLPLAESQQVKLRVGKTFLLSDLVVYHKMSVSVVRKLYDFGFNRMTNTNLPAYPRANA